MSISGSKFRIRPALPSDVPGAAVANVEGWRSAFDGLLSPEFLTGISVEARASALAARFSEPDYGMAVAETSDDGIIGFVDWGPGRDGHAPESRELYAIYVRPSFQGRGVGRALFGAAVESTLDAGHGKLVLCVLALNPHVRFYERLGGSEMRRTLIELDGEERELVYFEWSERELRELAAP